MEELKFKKALEKLGQGDVSYNWDELKEEVILIYSGLSSDKKYEGGYWDKNGVYQKVYEFLMKTYMPDSGPSANKKVNVFTDVQRIYYDMYNNGWCNRRGFDYTKTMTVKTPEIIKQLNRDIKNLVIRKSGRYDTPFTYHDIEYAMNAAIRYCLDADDLDDEKLYPNIDLRQYYDKDDDEDDDEDDEEEDEEEEDDEDEDEDVDDDDKKKRTRCDEEDDVC